MALWRREFLGLGLTLAREQFLIAEGKRRPIDSLDLPDGRDFFLQRPPIIRPTETSSCQNEC